MADEPDVDREETVRTPLDGWGAEWKAPPSLREATLQAARARGLVRGGIMSGRGFWMGAGVAAAALMFVVGFGLGERQGGRAGEASMRSANGPAGPAATEAALPAGQQRYALFLFEDASYQAPAGDALRARITEYSGWARGLAQAGHYVTGDKLADDGRFCRLEGGNLSAAGPQSDAKRGVLAGYFVIGAASLDEAMRLAGGCPHLKYGGTVEIRRIEES